jgi:hypothetical protein
MRSDCVHWKAIFMQAMNESDREKLRRLVRDAEVAIFFRREILCNSAAALEEMSSMAVAIEASRTVRAHQLSGPSRYAT